MSGMIVSDDPQWWDDRAFELLERHGKDPKTLTEELTKLLAASLDATLRFDEDDGRYMSRVVELSEACSPVIRVAVYSYDFHGDVFVEYTEEILAATRKLAEAAPDADKAKIRRARMFAIWMVFVKRVNDESDGYEKWIQKLRSDFAESFTGFDLVSPFEHEIISHIVDFIEEHGTVDDLELFLRWSKESINTTVRKADDAELRDNRYQWYATSLLRAGRMDEVWDMVHRIDGMEAQAWTLFRIVLFTDEKTYPPEGQVKRKPFSTILKIVKKHEIPNKKEVFEAIDKVMRYVAALNDVNRQRTILNYWADELVQNSCNRDFYPLFAETLRTSSFFDDVTKTEYVDILGTA